MMVGQRSIGTPTPRCAGLAFDWVGEAESFAFAFFSGVIYGTIVVEVNHCPSVLGCWVKKKRVQSTTSRQQSAAHSAHDRGHGCCVRLLQTRRCGCGLP